MTNKEIVQSTSLNKEKVIQAKDIGGQFSIPYLASFVKRGEWTVFCFFLRFGSLFIL